MELDPVHQDRNGYWWFYTETWADREGPFTTEEEARQHMDYYCKYMLGDKNDTF